MIKIIIFLLLYVPLELSLIHISVDELKRIRDVKLFKSVHIMARDIFMLTYYLGGITGFMSYISHTVPFSEIILH